jgi:16S rRNA (guanine1516-N2)-methyltransferase
MSKKPPIKRKVIEFQPLLSCGLNGGNMDSPENLPRIDFLRGVSGFRLFGTQSYRHPLARSIGVTPKKMPTVIDATAGLGRDAFLLAQLGCHVTMIERCPLVFFLLADAMSAAANSSPAAAGVVSRMELIHADAKDLLPMLTCDTIYIDPMHPVKKKSALSKADMRALRGIVGTDDDGEMLVKVALRSSCDKVVVKWPSASLSMRGLPLPSHSISEGSIRFDTFKKSLL